MQAVGIQLSHGLSALNTDNGQSIRDVLCSDQNCLTLSDTLLSRAVWVGQYRQPLCQYFPDVVQQYASRNLHFALTALAPLEAQLQHLIQGIPKHRLAIVMGTSTSGIADNQAVLQKQHHLGQQIELQHSIQAMSSLALALQDYLGWQGIAYSISTACSSSAKALASAQRLLNSDLADVVLVGGVDTLCPLTLNGFDSLDSLSKHICQPCGMTRDGINIGEAAALFVLTKDQAPVMLLAAGESMDAWHISAPHPEGVGAEQAMRQALQFAGLCAADIDYVNMHGTATPQNDAMEVKAIQRIFTHPVWVSSTKHKTGHCLGAAGAIEAFIAQQILANEQVWLPWHHAQPLDHQLQALNYVRTGQPIAPINYVMSNSFAFGGSNISLILARGTACNKP